MRTNDPRIGGGESALNEADDLAGPARDAYAAFFDRYPPRELAEEAGRVGAALDANGVVFGGDPPRPFLVDPVPRIVAAGEWVELERGLIQRVRALNRFLADVYGVRRIVAAGLLDERLIETAEWYEPAMAGDGMPPVMAHVAGPDLVRGADGVLRVLEDNLRAPSGLAYALAARAAVGPLAAGCGLAPRSLAPAVEALAAMLRAAAPAGVKEPRIVLAGDGERAGTRYEHLELAGGAGLEVASATDLGRDGERLLLGDSPVDVLYRRVDDERLSTPDGGLTPLGELLVEPLRAGTLACVNSPGSGVADDKAIHTRVEAMIGFYLDEEPLLPSVPGRWLGAPGELEEALARLGELVVKPRSEFGGSGVVIGPRASAAHLAHVAELIAAKPEDWIAQEPVALSTLPVVADGELESRHVDLRPFVITSPGNRDNEEMVTVVPGGLTRFAREAGSMVVNSGQGGGAKDTWVL